MKRFARLATAALLLASGPISLADVVVIGDDSAAYYLIEVSGVISRDACESLNSIVASRGDFPAFIRIGSSPGGDIRSAMCVGEIIRDAALMTSLDGHCDSACFLIWAAGVTRVTHEESTFGLHRPRFEHQYFSALPHSEATEQYKALDAAVRDYLKRMDVSVAVIDRMMTTKSTSLDRVSALEIVSIVGRSAPAYEEWIISKCGEMEASEESDLNALKLSLLADRQLYDEPSKQGFSETHAAYEKPTQISEGYQSYLWKRSGDISECRGKAQAELQKQFLETMK